jgi:hypothetical protein
LSKEGIVNYFFKKPCSNPDIFIIAIQKFRKYRTKIMLYGARPSLPTMVKPGSGTGIMYQNGSNKELRGRRLNIFNY